MTKNDVDNLIVTHESLVIGATYNILFTNDIVLGRILEAVEAIKKTSLFKQKTKQMINKVMKEKIKYEKLISKVIGDKSSFFADANDIFIEEVKKDIDILYFTIKKEFDKHKLQYSDVIAKMETARTLCYFACVQLDKRMDELISKDNRFKNFSIDYIRQTSMLHYIDETMRTFQIPFNIDLNTKECTTAINILSKKLADCDIISKAISA